MEWVLEDLGSKIAAEDVYTPNASTLKIIDCELALLVFHHCQQV